MRFSTLAALVLLGSSTSGQQRAEFPSFFELHCNGCHSGPDGDAGLDLETFRPRLEDRKTLETLRRVRDRVAAAEMPPPADSELSPEERRRFTVDASALLARAGRELELKAGRVTLRRLSRFEYDRTTRDLLGVTTEFSDRFPVENLGYGFDNIGDALSFSTIHLEKYLAAAEDLARKTINTEDPENPTVRHVEAEDMESKVKDAVGNGDVARLYSRGTVEAAFKLPRDGVYRIRAAAYAQQAGPEIARMALTIGAQPATEWEIPETRKQLGIREFEIRLSGGRQLIGLSFVNDYYDEDNPDPKQRDRNLYIDWVEVIGPIDALVPSRGHAWILAADPGRGSLKHRTSKILDRLLSRVWRRPAKSAEIRKMGTLVQDRMETGESLLAAIRTALTAALASPSFIFRIEVGGKGNGDRSVDLKPHDLATRLSFFLWSSAPDETLFRLAAEGKLSNPKVLLDETQRLLGDDRADALALNFASQWLELRNLEDTQPDADRFPDFDDELRRSMARESELLFEAVLRENRDIRELLTADFSHHDQRLARHYHRQAPEGDGFTRVSLEGTTRRGLLGHAGILCVTSSPTRTSPVKRGKWVLENLLDAAPPPPPPGADSLVREEELQTPAGLRERLAVHRSRGDCASCHIRMDALGFALENFDAVGRWRDLDGDVPIDASGELPDGTHISGPSDLTEVLAQGKGLARALASKLFTYAIGRSPTGDDRLALEALVADLPDEGATLSDIIGGIVLLDAFRQRSVAR